MNTEMINTEKLHELYSTSDEAKAILNTFAKRINARKKTTVDSVMAETQYPRAQIIQVLHELQNVGCGTFKAGRRGFVSRFEWAVNLSDVGKAAQGAKTAVQALVSAQDDDETEAPKKLRHPEHAAYVPPPKAAEAHSKDTVTSPAADAETLPQAPVKRKRGRPLGSRNHIALSPSIRQRFALRPNFMVGLTLPRDLTQAEAKKIGEYVYLIAQEG